jgi:hypothetical protein
VNILDEVGSDRWNALVVKDDTKEWWRSSFIPQKFASNDEVMESMRYLFRLMYRTIAVIDSEQLHREEVSNAVIHRVVETFFHGVYLFDEEERRPEKTKTREHVARKKE